MKKIILITFGCLLLNNLNAQLEKGTQLIGLSGSFSQNQASSQGHKNSSRIQYSIVPTYKFFIRDNFYIGTSLSYSSISSYYYSSNSKNLTLDLNQYNFELNAGKFFSLTEKLFLSINSGIYVGYLESRFQQQSNVTNYGSSFGINISPSLNYFLNDKWMISSSFGNLYYNLTNTRASSVNSSSSSFGLNLTNSSLSIGINYKF